MLCNKRAIKKQLHGPGELFSETQKSTEHKMVN